MNDFINQFSLFGIALIVLIPFIAEGIKSAWENATGIKPTGWAAVLTVVFTSWFLIGLEVVTEVWPELTPWVRIILGLVLVPITAMGVRTAATSAMDKLKR